MIIDAHAHLNVEPFINEDISLYIERACLAGVDKIINVGADRGTSFKAVDMLSMYDGFYATVGVHPHDAGSFDDNVYKEFVQLCSNNDRIVAIGECGLDYFRNLTPVNVQKLAFERQVQLAKELNLPLVIHTREAERDTLELLDCMDITVPLVVHCFTGTFDFAVKLWERGFFTSFTGIITFKNAADLREVVKAVPFDRFMVETDCPYLAPQEYRGKTNEPSYIVEVVKEIARIKGVSYEEIVDISTKNAKNFYNI